MRVGSRVISCVRASVGQAEGGITCNIVREGKREGGIGPLGVGQVVSRTVGVMMMGPGVEGVIVAPSMPCHDTAY